MSLEARQRFPKTARLLKRSEFLKLSRSGAKVHSANFVVISSANDRGTRLGITVSSQVGNSVVRNRIKRRVREFFRCRRGVLPVRIDLLIIARRSAADLDSKTIASELESVLTSPPGRRGA